jgi:glycosyltransferase involved in cell wall biosynthesis
MVFGSFGPSSIPSGISSALENILNSPLRDAYTVLLASTFRVDRNPRGIWRRLLYGTWLLSQAVFKLGTRRPNVVDIHAVSGRDFLKNSVIVIAARACGIPAVLRIHGGDFDRVFAEAGVIEKTVIRAVLRLADRVAVLSRGWEKIVMRIEGRARTIVLPNCVDCDAFAAVRHTSMKDPNTILMLGNFCERKGHFDAVEAAAIVKRSYPQATFRFFGSERDPGALAQLQILVKERGLGGTVHFCAPVFGIEKIRQICNSGVFILPSHTENMPMAVIEAMAAGVPVVATRVGAIPEMIDDGKTGVLIEPRAPEGLAQAIMDLLADGKRRMCIGTKAAQIARNTWDMKVVGASTARLYDALSHQPIQQAPL